MAFPGGVGRSDKFSRETWVPNLTQGSYLFRSIKADAWNQLFPFQLMIIQEEDDGKFTVTPWNYTLPMSPQELQISMPVADKLEPTLTGFVETHGGAPFRMISFSGTTGIIPETSGDGRGSVTEGTGPASFVTQYAAPLLSAASTLVSGGAPRTRNEYSKTSFPNATTGFYAFHQLRQFLEGYLAIKGAGKPIRKGEEDEGGHRVLQTVWPNKVRLAFCMWKDNSVYLCKLNNFELRRSADSPLEYRYALSLQAYRRVDLGKDGLAYENFKFPIPKKNIISEILNRIDAVRKIVANAANLVNLGIVGPLAVLSELSRQISGIIKDTLGVVRSILDMPAAFVNGVLNAAFEVQQAAMSGAAGVEQSFRQLQNLPQAIENKLNSLGWGRKGPQIAGPSVNTWAETTQTDNQPAVGGRGNGGSDFRRPDVTDGQQMNNTNIDPTELMQELPELGELPVTAFPLSKDQREQLDAEVQASRSVSVADIEQIRESVQQSLDSFAISVGAWNATYNAAYGIPSPTTEQREPTREELDVIFAINDFMQSLDHFVNYLRSQGGSNTPTVKSIEYVAGLAERSGIDFSVPRSKYAVPFPYGHTLERVAMQFLGDANRWHEIAVLNGLRAPYVDEVGFQLPLLVNGDQNEIVVGNRDNLFIGQPVWLSSSGVRREARRILGIRKSGPTTFVLLLDGEPDLSRFRVAEDAVMETYLPGTVNSRQVIYIPNDGPSAADENLASIPGVDPYDPMLRVGGVDWLLTSDLDLVVTPYGDNPLAIGLTNLSQGAMVAFMTERGALLQHPRWGMGIKPGTSVADLDMGELIQGLESFFNGDPAISGLQSVNILQKGPSLLLDVQLGVRGMDRTIPILLDLNAKR